MYLIQNLICFLMILLGAMAYPQPTTGDNIQSNSILSDRKVNDAFQDGEWFRLRMRYGILNAMASQVGYVIQSSTFGGNPAFFQKFLVTFYRIMIDTDLI